MKRRSNRPRIGRPPAGARQGEKVKDYPQISLRLPPDTRTLLHRLAQTTRQPQWRIVREALSLYVASLPPARQPPSRRRSNKND